MDALILKAVAVLAISIAAFVLVSIYAWPSNVTLARRFAAWCRSLPSEYRKLRDPEYRRRRACAERYDAVMGGLLMAGAMSRMIDRERSEAVESGRSGVPEGRRADDAAVMLDANRLVSAAYLSRLADDEIAFIASHLNAEAFDGKADEAVLRSFLAEERDLAASQPHLVRDHVQRLLRRVAPLMGADRHDRP